MTTDITPDTPLPDSDDPEGRLRFLLEYAVLAPSSHNTQPWWFDVDGSRLRLYVDRDRWLRVADADQRELYISAGCALENLMLAAAHFAVPADMTLFPEVSTDTLVAEVHLGEGEPGADTPELFAAITARHTNHGVFDARPIPDADRTRLEAAVTDPKLGVLLTADVSLRRKVDELVTRADAIQFADPLWREELGDWLSRGVFGNGWLMAKVGGLAVTYLNMGRSIAKKDTELLDSASLLGVITARGVDRDAQVRVGRAFERLFLTATALGIQLHPMNQILQVPEVRSEFRAMLPPEQGEPQIAFRLGYAETEPGTPRRPIEEMLVRP